jgi:hypothetical protein
MIDVFDIIAFVLFGVLLAVIVQVVVTLGSLPGQIARLRRVRASGAEASYLTTAGSLWPFAKGR